MVVEQIFRTGSQLLSSALSAPRSAFGILFAILLILGVNELIRLVAFECPCIDSTSFGSNFVLLNGIGYGWFFIIIPTAIVFFGNLAMTLSVKKCLTGCCNNENKCCSCCFGCYYCSWQSVCSILGNILFPPGLWLAVSFIDGDYFACAETQKP